MKKLIIKILFGACVFFVPVSAMAGVSVHVDIPLPPQIIFLVPPEVIVLPETDVYAVPDVNEEIFFYSGWWWRPWEGRWYCSRYYDRGWAYYRGVPSFHRNIPPRWRDDYRNNMWRGQRWEHQRIPNRDMQRNWNTWQKDRHWEKQNSWGVQGLNPRQDPRQKKEMKSQPQMGPMQSRGMKENRNPRQDLRQKKEMKSQRQDRMQSREMKENRNIREKKNKRGPEGSNAGREMRQKRDVKSQQQNFMQQEQRGNINQPERINRNEGQQQSGGHQGNQGNNERRPPEGGPNRR